MRRMGLVWGAVIVVVSAVIAGCASVRGFRCGGDLVPINPPSKVAAMQQSKHAARPSRTAGESP